MTAAVVMVVMVLGIPKTNLSPFISRLLSPALFYISITLFNFPPQTAQVHFRYLHSAAPPVSLQPPPI